jgi:hypothetical protein
VLEKAGIPTVVVGTTEFLPLGRLESRSRGLPELPFAITEHPLGGLRPPAVLAKVDPLVHEVAGALLAGGSK